MEAVPYQRQLTEERKHRMLRIFQTMINTLMIIVVVSIAVTIPAVFQDYMLMKKFTQTLVVYGERNGGMIPLKMQGGGLWIQTTPETYVRDLMTEFKLNDNFKFEDIEFEPALGVQVNKREKFTITVHNAKIKMVLPFAQEQTLNLNPIEAYGYSHKYFK